MSFDLAFWWQDSPPNREEAAQVYDKLTDGLEGVVEESPAIEAFYQAVISMFPDLAEDNTHDSPWSSSIYVTQECVIVAISWSRAGEISSILLELAAKHGLTAYDPQDHVVHEAR
ncbi:hypothetical protein Nocox_09370 [Nonomuraea coxensis DSM 45129]|uniref:Uncharacterized protein n=1 Tax=Nonomuraea coxensis DSM 45129 TaxID=1122611 RepID=A0ABX8TY76_9ACTN|nr:hypothetical protein [Nonomuraea coxensis]QYC39494.1 hypothetical protein Nocox_09370 [Nonomuraea coxensis DSM 45129]